MTLTDVDVISVCWSRGKFETDAGLIYAAKLHLDACRVCNAVNWWAVELKASLKSSFNRTGKYSSIQRTWKWKCSSDCRLLSSDYEELFENGRRHHAFSPEKPPSSQHNSREPPKERGGEPRTITVTKIWSVVRSAQLSRSAKGSGESFKYLFNQELQKKEIFGGKWLEKQGCCTL